MHKVHVIPSSVWLEPVQVNDLPCSNTAQPAQPGHWQEGGEDKAIKRLDNYFWKFAVCRPEKQLRWQHFC